MATAYVYAFPAPLDAVNTSFYFGSTALKRKGTNYFVQGTTAVTVPTGQTQNKTAIAAAAKARFDIARTSALQVPAHTPVITLHYRIYIGGYQNQFVTRRLIAEGQVIGAASTQPKVGAYFGRPGQFLGWYDDQGRVG